MGWPVERSRDLLSGRDQHVGLARVGRFTEFAGELEQPVGLAGHRGNHDDQAITALARPRHTLGDRLNPLDRADRSPTVLLHQQRHRKSPIRHKKWGNR